MTLGTGLGLSISKRLIDIMNGSLSLISKVDKGSTFIIDIPNISIGQLDNKIDKSEILNFEEQLTINNINSSINKEIEIKNIKAINPEMLEKIAKLKDGLWLDCINKNRVSDMKTFANLMLKIGSEYNHYDTMEYSKLLQSYINSFDLKNTKELLNQYPTILEIYKSNINKE